MSKKINYQFLILQAIGIILVVLGHKGGISLATDWFPPYSFHIPLFIFISGYFYKTNYEECIWKFILKKIKKLLVPYFVWNIIYGCIIFILKKYNVVNYGDDMSFNTLFIRPWIDGHQFVFNIPAWFVITLFLIQISYICMRKILSFIKLDNEIIIMMLLLAMGYLSILRSNNGYSYGWNLTFVKVLFLMPFYQMGYIYNRYLEQRDNMSNYMYFMCIFIVQFFLIKKYNNINFTVAWCNDFNRENLFLPYITSATGIMFWLRISKILVPSLRSCKKIQYLGNNTWTVMMHHLFIFFIINLLIGSLAPIIGLKGFDYNEFKKSIWYCYVPGNKKFQLFYSVLAIYIPLMIKYYSDKAILKIKSEISYKRIKR